ncbi:MAG: hypothetical protein ACHP6H_07205 [Legionellales bacterium]
MDNNKFWLGVWAICGTVLITLMLCISVSNQSSNEKILEMVKVGADPIAANCAIVGLNNYSTPVICDHVSKKQN